MIRISKKVNYAVIVLSHLARHGGKPVSARRIARRYGISYSLVANVLKIMVGAGWAVSSRGVLGGYRLTKPPEKITLDDVIMAVEGPYRFVDCASPEMSAKCAAASKCPARKTMLSVHQRLRKLLRGVTVRDLAGSS